MDRLEGARIVPERKVTAYLLDERHPIGAGKAKFFRQFGFSADAPEYLMRSLVDHPERNPIVATEHSAFGIKSIVECHVVSPDGRNPCIRTVWMQDTGTDAHRLVTAYPLAQID